MKINYEWLEEDKQKIAETVGKGLCKTIEVISGHSDPTGTSARAVGEFAKAAAPVIAGASQQMMENTYNQNETASQKYMKEHFMRDANGTPITAEEGRKIALANADKNSKQIDTEKEKSEKTPSEEVDEYGVKKETVSNEKKQTHNKGIKR